MLIPQVIYKDPDFLVVDKPAGLLVHGAGISLVDWLLKNYPEVKNVGDDPKERPGIVHRLDKDTSGVLLICLNQKTFDYFKKLFQEHKIKKTYLALVYGIPKEKEGIIEKPLGFKGGSIKRTAHLKKARLVKEAVTKYKVKEVFAGYALLAVEPLTGRTHQIRVHLAALGHPVVGDRLYGSRKNVLKIPRQFLHAESLEFIAPGGGRLKIETDLPQDLKAVLDSIQ